MFPGTDIAKVALKLISALFRHQVNTLIFPVLPGKLCRTFRQLARFDG